jgi:putative ABC transport system permease protein
MAVVDLSLFDLLLAAALLLINGGVSLGLSLGLERQLLIAAVRMTVQLLLVGLILKTLFALTSPGWTALVALVMALFAGHEILARQERPLQGLWSYGLGALTMTFAATIVTLLALSVILQPQPWYTPRYAIPLFGMILGNAMTGISLGLNMLTTGIERERSAIEAQLMLGATRWQALRPLTRRALKSALMPTINSMSATGVVFLPGMMTGQILSGIEPTLAVRYQLLVMFLIAGSTGLGALLAILGSVWRVTDERHRLRIDRLRPE